jgi:hypothetical protein
MTKRDSGKGGENAMSGTVRALRTIALAFALLFTLAATGQYWFLRYQLHKETANDLRDSAETLRDQIAFANAWNLEPYRRTSEGPDTYIVVASNGTLIDVAGYFLGMLLSNVSLPPGIRDNPNRVVPFVSDVGERWNLYLHPLSDRGIVILGVRSEVALENLEQLFAQNAARFGTTIGEALHTPERAIHESVEYAIIDANGVLRWAIGGIPLKAAVADIPDHSTLVPVRHVAEKVYSTFLDPIVSQSGMRVGLISVFDDITDEQRMLRNSAIFNGVVATFVWLATVALAAAYLRRVRPDEISCSQIPFLDESEHVEFKSSLRWDYVNQKMNRELEKATVKTVAGFLNSEGGGTLVIGVSDRNEPLGLEPDYSTLKTRQDRDGFEQALRQTLINAVGEHCCASFVKIRFCTLKGKEICVVTVAPAREEVYVEEEGRPIMYVRIGNTSRPLNVKEAVAYAKDRWGGAIHWSRFRHPAPQPGASVSQ